MDFPMRNDLPPKRLRISMRHFVPGSSGAFKTNFILVESGLSR
jgi:hypothetical protein